MFRRILQEWIPLYLLHMARKKCWMLNLSTATYRWRRGVLCASGLWRSPWRSPRCCTCGGRRVRRWPCWASAAFPPGTHGGPTGLCRPPQAPRPPGGGREEADILKCWMCQWFSMKYVLAHTHTNTHSLSIGPVCPRTKPSGQLFYSSWCSIL